MKIKPIKCSIEHIEDQYAVNMYVSASDSWGNEQQNEGPSYNAIAVLTDKSGIIRKRLTVTIPSEEYSHWDGSNYTVLQMFLDKYDFLKLDNDNSTDL